MTQVFPFHLPTPTAIYLVIYVCTLVLHVALMNYVLAGSAYVAAASAWTRLPTRLATEVVVLRDWMPFALSGAITAAVAPLLFVQILYSKAFYTANLLLFHRWMAILPVLIVGFYLLYLLKARQVESWRPWLRNLIPVVAFLCFAFTGYSWTENHLLSLDQSSWLEQYAAQSKWYKSSLTVPRFATWFFGSFSAMGLILLWQLRGHTPANPHRRAEHDPPPGFSPTSAAAALLDCPPYAAIDITRIAQRLAVPATAGLVLSASTAVWYYSAAGPQHRAAVLHPFARPYLIAAGIGVLVQIAGWTALRIGWTGRPGWLITTSIAAAITMVGTSVVRESIRIVHMDMPALAELHAKSSESGGMAVFLAFLAINIALIAVAIRLVRGRTQPV